MRAAEAVWAERPCAYETVCASADGTSVPVDRRRPRRESFRPMARKVTTPDGYEWKVGRDWAPWRVRLPGKHRDRATDGASEGAWWGAEVMAEAGGIFTALALFIIVIVLFAVVWPVVAIAVEIVVLILGAAIFTALRASTIKRWAVVARGETGRELVWHVRGWRASRRKIEEITAALGSGLPVPEPEN